MKLRSGLLLVILMICCYSVASADSCRLPFSIFANLLTASHENIMNVTAPFTTTSSMKKAMSSLKHCIDNHSEDLSQIYNNILAKCAEDLKSVEGFLPVGELLPAEELLPLPGNP